MKRRGKERKREVSPKSLPLFRSVEWVVRRHLIGLG